jgi:Phage tail lysozyme
MITMASYPTESNVVSGGYYENNLVSIAEFLMANGYSRAAAAGVAGTSAGEGNGNPESVGTGGQGLIGWTPPTVPTPHTDIVTGNAQQDFDNQLDDLLYYANTNSSEAVRRGGVDISTLKAATDPLQAATWWSEFEGPKVPGSDLRTAETENIYNALAGYTPNSGYTQPAAGGAGTTASTSSNGTSGSSGGTQCVGVTLFGHCFGATIPSVSALEGDVMSWLERAGLFILGGVFLIMGTYIMIKDTGAIKYSETKEPDEDQQKSAVASGATDAAEVAAVA